MFFPPHSRVKTIKAGKCNLLSLEIKTSKTKGDPKSMKSTFKAQLPHIYDLALCPSSFHICAFGIPSIRWRPGESK